MGGHWLRAMTINEWVWLDTYKPAQDDHKGICVKVWHENPMFKRSTD